jgi:2-polyprenyl-3-methyl-5-hydroxy-6-metoxy-1,4-benzoquinol methylase
MLSTEQQLQENKYVFPYHYIPDVTSGGVTLSRRWEWAVNYLGRLELVANVLKRQEFSSFCDIGCGDGRLINILSRALPNKSFLGIDYSRRAIELATIMNDAPNAQFRCLDILNADVVAPFDGISLIEVLEHIPIPELSQFVIRAAAYLRPGGFAIITVPSKELPLVRKHFQHFDLQHICGILKEGGLHVEEASYIDRSDIVFKVMRRLMYNSFISIEIPKLTQAFLRYYRTRLLCNQTNGNGVFVLCTKP